MLRLVIHEPRRSGVFLSSKTKASIAALLVGSALLVTACGEGSGGDDPSAVNPSAYADTPPPDPAAMDITCAELDDAQASRRAQTALADYAQIPNLSRLQAGQSIYYAMTELCKGEPGSYAPGTDAIEAVRDGKYRFERPAGTDDVN
jgi:hypothetical protein